MAEARLRGLALEERLDPPFLLVAIVIGKPVADAGRAREREPTFGTLRLQLLEKNPVAADERRVILADVRLTRPAWSRRRKVDDTRARPHREIAEREPLDGGRDDMPTSILAVSQKVKAQRFSYDDGPFTGLRGPLGQVV